MSTTIDQRVVEMQFDNRQFENNVATTMSSLDKLKQSLNFSGASKGFEDVDNAAKKVDMNGLGAAVETVRMKFSALQVMGVTALSNITNSAVNAGKRIVSALTIDPIKTGLSEYETQINAVQTILANTESKGSTLTDVNNALDALNTYADKTIYNFTEMTRNIGTFTAAGVDLDTSVNAIQGIANLAAVSGSTSQQASTAMYQLSQALSSGTVKLMDWNSVVNAGMGGQVFQDALMETARVHGVAIDDMIKENGSFRETLQEGWLTADVLIETLSKFTMGTEGLTEAEIKANREKLKNIGYTDDQIDAIFKLGNTATNAATKVKTFTQLWDTLKETAQSGWTQTWEIIFGDFEEAKSFFSDLYNTLAPIIEASGQARNELLKGWKDGGGRKDLIDSLYNLFEVIKRIVVPIKEAFRDIFPPATADQLISITSGLKSFTESLKIGAETSDKLKRTFRGLFAVVDIVWHVFSNIAMGVGYLFGQVTGLGGGLLDITAKFGDWLVALRDGIRESKVFSGAIMGIVGVLKFAIDGISVVLGWLGSIVGSLDDIFTGFGSVVSATFKSVSSAIEECSILRIFMGILYGVKTVISAIVEVFRGLVTGVGSVFGESNFEGILNIVKSIVAGGLGVALIKFIKSLKNTFDGVSDVVENVGGMFENAGELFGSLGDSLQAFTNQVKSKTLMNIAIAIGILSASLLVLSFIDSDKLYDSIIAIAALFAGLIGSMALITKSISKTKGLAKISTSMIGIATAVLILAFALKTMASLDMQSMGTGLLGIAGLMAIVVLTVKALDGNKMMKGALQLVIFAAAIKVLASACEDMAFLSWDELARGLVGVSALLAAVVVFLRTAKFDSKALSTSIGIIALSAAIKILASACADFAYMSWDEIKKGLTSVSVLLAELMVFTKLTGNAKGMISTGLGMIAIAAAMKIFASVAKDMASMTWGELAKGLVGISGALMAVAIALKLMPKNLISYGIGFVIVSSALMVLAEVFDRMGGMSWSGIAKGLVAIGGSLLILAAGLKMMNGSVSGSAALVVASVALGLMVPVLVKLGGMSWKSINKGLFSLAAALTVIGVAAYLLQPLLPAILSLAGALALIGLSVALVGAGLAAAGVGLTAIAAGLVSLVGGLAGSVGLIVDLVASVISGLAKGIADGIVVFCEVITRGLPAIGKAVKAIVITVIDVLVECIPPLVDGILKLVFKLLESLARHAPVIIDSLFDLLIGILDGLARRLPDLISSLVNIVVSLIQGVIDALGNAKFKISLDELINIGALVGIMAAMAALAPLVPMAMAGVIGFGVLVGELAIVLAAVGALSKIPGLTWLVGEGGDLLEAIGTSIGRFVGGIVGGVAQGFTSSLPQIGFDLSAFMRNVKPFVEGAKQIDDSVVNGVKSLIGVVLAITATDVIQSITSWVTGGSSIGEFASQLPVLGRGLKGFSDSVVGVSAENVTAAANAAKALALMTGTIPNEGGVASWFAGENSISNFGDELPALGRGLKGFSDAVVGISPENIVAAATAAKALTDMTSHIPNQGGVVSWFAGENSVSKFAEDIVTLGMGLKGFSLAVFGIVPENIVAAATAAKALAEMTTYIPNEGGVLAWFTGENSITRFADDIVELGFGLRGFATSVNGIIPDNVTAGAAAAKALAEMTSYIPNQGGVISWITGENSITRFASQLPVLGRGLLGFAMSVAGISTEHVSAAASAAKSLAELTATLPNQGGVVAWFAGEQSISKFGQELTALGRGLNGFGQAVDGVNTEQIIAGANAAKTLAEMTNHIPNEGGVKSWFTGETSIANFASALPALGRGLGGFSTAVEGINAENVTAAAHAAKALAEMTAVIPTEGGIKAWFTGETSIANFADKLPTLGKGLAQFSTEVAEIVPENVTAAAGAAKSLAEMTNIVPGDTSKLSKFGENLSKFGEKLKSYFSKTSGITAESVSATSGVIDVVERVSTLDSGNIKSVSNSIENIAKSLKNLSKVPEDCTSKFNKAMEELVNSSSEKLAKALESIEQDTKNAGADAITAFVKGVESKASTAKTACTDIADACSKAIGGKAGAFTAAGKDLVDGFASGISANTFKAAAKARAMAQAALNAAKDELDINSPSKVFRAIGTSVPEGFAAGIDKLTGMVKTSSVSMADTAIDVVGESIASLADIVNRDIDAQPTVRPVLDLSDIKSGAKSIGGLFSGSSVGVLANVGAISASMNRRSQNGGNDEVVSAINKLHKDFDKFKGDTYNFGDIAYGDNSEVQDAVRTLVRAVKIGGRS